MTLFDDFFSPMRMPSLNHHLFAGDFGGDDMGTISSFNISFGFEKFCLFGNIY